MNISSSDYIEEYNGNDGKLASKPQKTQKERSKIITSSLHVTTCPPTKFESLKSWSFETLECAKQYVNERIGRKKKTIDPDVEKKICLLKELQQQFRTLRGVALTLYQQYIPTLQTHYLLGCLFEEMERFNGNEDLKTSFALNCSIQKIVTLNGNPLLKSLEVFIKSMDTLCETTMEDALDTVKQMESSRLSMDSCFSCLEKAKNSTRDAHYTLRVQEAERSFTKNQKAYKRLHHDLTIKLKFLEENRLSVCQKHLSLLQAGFVQNIRKNKEDLDKSYKSIESMTSNNNKELKTNHIENINKTKFKNELFESEEKKLKENIRQPSFPEKFDNSNSNKET